MAIYTVRKWRKTTSKNGKTGAILECSYYSEENEKWLNVNVYVPMSANYAGKDDDEVPATLAKTAKNNPETLIVQCTVFDDYVPAKKEEQKAKKGKKTKAEDEEPDF